MGTRSPHYSKQAKRSHGSTRLGCTVHESCLKDRMTREQLEIRRQGNKGQVIKLSQTKEKRRVPGETMPERTRPVIVIEKLLVKMLPFTF